MTCCLSKAELSGGHRVPSLDNAASHDDLPLDCKALLDMTNKCTTINTTDIVTISITKVTIITITLVHFVKLWSLCVSLYNGHQN